MQKLRKLLIPATDDMKEQVLVLHSLAQQLRTKRFSAGAFAFEKVEVKI